MIASATDLYHEYRYFAHLSADEKRRFVSQLTDQEALQLKYTWEAWARDKQLAPSGSWVTWLLLAGRGFGKTRCALECVRNRVESGKWGRVARVGRTAADVSDVIIEGET